MQHSAVIKAFLTAWAQPNQWRSAVLEYFAEDCEYENVGLSKTLGRAQAVAFIEQFVANIPFVTMDVDIHHMIESGNVVMNERTEIFRDRRGTVVLTMKLMGMFELRGDKIAVWHDYCDMSQFKTAPDSTRDAQ